MEWIPKLDVRYSTQSEHSVVVRQSYAMLKMKQNKLGKIQPFTVAGLMLLAVTLAFFLYIAIFISTPFLKDYFQRISFDSEHWKNWEETEAECCTRWRMIRSLVSQHDLVGMKHSEVIELLGKPKYDSEQVLIYYLGMTGQGINSGSLSFYLNKEGKIVSFEVSSE